jgi:hypothetical protein
MVVAAYSFFFSIAAIVPIAGPSFLAYLTGANKRKNETNGISKIHFLVAMIVSELVLLIISGLIYYILSGFYDPKGFWKIIAIALGLNALLAIIFFYLGNYHAKKGIKFLSNVFNIY